MKTFVKKLIATLQVMVIIVSAMLTTISMLGTVSYAKNNYETAVEEVESGKILINSDSIWSTSKHKNINIWVDGDSSLNYSVSSNGLEIKLDAGTNIWITPEKNEYRERHYYTEIYFSETMGGGDDEYYTSLSSVSEINLSADRLIEKGGYYTGVGYDLEYSYYLKVYALEYKYYGQLQEYKLIGEVKIIINANKIELVKQSVEQYEEPRIDLETSSSARIYNNQLYLKPNTEYYISTDWGIDDSYDRPDDTKNGSYTYDAGLIAIGNGDGKYKSKLTTRDKLGTTRLTWTNNYGSSCYLDIVVSNFWSKGDLENVQANNDNTTVENGCKYRLQYDKVIDQTVTVKANNCGAIKIIPTSKFEGIKPIMTGVTAVDYTGFTDTKITTTSNNSNGTIEFSFNAKADGLIKIEFENFEGTKYTEYWEVVTIGNTNLTEISGEDGKSDGNPIIPEEDGENTTTEKTELENGAGGNNSGDDNIIKPEIKCSHSKIDETSFKLNITTTNCKAAKWYFVDKETTVSGKYSDLPGTVVSNPNSFEVILDCDDEKYKSGEYWFVVVAKNNNDSETAIFNGGPLKVNNTPRATIGIKSTTLQEKVFDISGMDVDGDDVTVWYYVSGPTTSVTQSNTLLSASEIKSKGKQLENTSDKITISIENGYEAGNYNLYVLVEDSNGATHVAGHRNIKIDNAPEVSYKIDCEDGNSTEGYTFSKKLIDKKIVTVNIKDIDKNDTITTKYFISTEDITEQNTVTKDRFMQSFYTLMYKSDVKTLTFDSNNATFNIPVSATEATQQKMYVYILVQDKLGISTYVSTGTIVVDGSDLQLDVIYLKDALEESKSENYYTAGNTLEVVCEFNHIMKEQAPDLYLKFGQIERKQDKISYEDYKVIYSYNIKSDDANGKISVSRFNYVSENFKDAYIEENEYNIAFENETNNLLNLIDNYNYYIDTKIPTITKIEIAYKTDENSKIYKNAEDGKTYIRNASEIKCILTYDEKIIGAALLMMDKGNEYGFNMDIEGENTLTSIVDLKTKNALGAVYEGGYDVLMFNNVLKNMTDLAGNPVRLNDNVEYVYTLNGTNYKKDEIIIDDVVYNGLISVGKEIADDDITINVGTEVQCFAEYKNKNELDYADASGVKTISLDIYSNDNGIELKDKDGNVIAKNESVENNSEEYSYLNNYTLTEEQLPVTFVATQIGTYNVVTNKIDNVGNISESDINIISSSLVSVNETLSGLNLGDTHKLNEYNNIFALDDSEKVYTLYLKADSSIDVNNMVLKVYDCFNTEVTVTKGKVITKDEQKYQTYIFNIDNVGKYRIQAYNKISETEETYELIMEDIISNINVYMPGDVNCDGIVNVMDPIYILQNNAGMLKNEEIRSMIKYTGKVNDDNIIDIADVIMLNRIISEDSRLEIITKEIIEKEGLNEDLIGRVRIKTDN